MSASGTSDRPIVGERLARRHAVDQSLIDAYAEASGDRNPLHVDPVFARGTHFGRTIAHGFMTLAFLCNAMRDRFGDAWSASGEMDVAFLAPVFAGDEVVVEVMVEEVSGTGRASSRASCGVRCRVEQRVVLAGSTHVDVASDGGSGQESK